MNLYESAEDYLEAILKISNEKSYVKSIDVAEELGFSKPSVSIAMKKLKDHGYITIGEHNYLELTETGLKIAQRIYERHLTLTKALMVLGVNEEQAKIDACKIEHDLSEETYILIKQHLEQND